MDATAARACADQLSAELGIDIAPVYVEDVVDAVAVTAVQAAGHTR